jgi:hypothetical protein
MPTIGQLTLGLAGGDVACALANFAREDLVPLVFAREEDAPDVRFCFAAIGLFTLALC